MFSFYDSMIAKLIVYGKNREMAIARMKRALEEFVVDGIKTTIPMHKRILEHHAFVEGDISTEFIERHFG